MGPEEAAAAAMAVGEAFVFLGSTFHGGGTNTTAKARPVHSFFYCRSYIRPEVCKDDDEQENKLRL